MKMYDSADLIFVVGSLPCEHFIIILPHFAESLECKPEKKGLKIKLKGSEFRGGKGVWNVFLAERTNAPVIRRYVFAV